MAGIEEIIEQSERPLIAGSCVLRNERIARIVQDALLHFEGERYSLAAWCVMPNHVHVVVAPIGRHRLSRVLQSWKSFTSKQINKVLGREGTLWERESFDHLIRTAEHFGKFVEYTESNHVSAGLCKRPEDWPFSSCGAGFQPASIEFVDPRKIPFVEPRSRGELPHLEKEGGCYFVTFRLADAVVRRK